MKKLLPAIALATMLAGCNDNTDTASLQTASNSEAILASLKSQGLTIHGPLEVPGGLQAYAASSGTQPLAVYIMPDANSASSLA